MVLPDESILLAKQPIYKKNHALFGFELLFRSNNYLTAVEAGEDLATSEVLVNYCTSTTEEIGQKHQPIFINVSESFLMSEAFLPIDKDTVIIELLERITVTELFVSAIKSWHKKGFRFALDDFDFSEQWNPVLPYVSFIKVDVLDADLEIVKANKVNLSHLKVVWLAERIEHRDMFDHCKEMGFELFQGYYLAKPKAVLGSSIRPSSAVTTEIIKKCNQKNISIDEISTIVTQDPKLSIQLLKLINSSLFTLPRPIHDLKEAITFLGIDVLKQWALMIAFVCDAKSPIESCRIVLTRAKTCELFTMKQTNNKEQADTAFLAGLLSGVDLLLELEPKILIHQMNLSSTIQAAILNHTGELGHLIENIKQIEFFLSQAPEKISTLDIELINQFSSAQDWAADVINTLDAS